MIDSATESLMDYRGEQSEKRLGCLAAKATVFSGWHLAQGDYPAVPESGMLSRPVSFSRSACSMSSSAAVRALWTIKRVRSMSSGQNLSESLPCHLRAGTAQG